MIKVTLTRQYTDGQNTIGRLKIEGTQHQEIFTCEDLWRNNQQRVSCVPAGTYKVIPHGWNNEPVKYTQVWRVTNVPGREAILIHSGNSHKDTMGCILVGLKVVPGGIQQSLMARHLLRRLIGKQSFELTIVDKTNNVRS